MVNSLTILQLRFSFEVIKDVQLPQYNSSTWRGWLGHAIQNTSIYAPFFEGIRPQDAKLFTTTAQIPQPYVVVNSEGQSGHITAGNLITMQLNLFGEAWRVLPVLVPAIEQACEHLTLGKGQGMIALQEIDYCWLNDPEWRQLPNLNIQPQSDEVQIPIIPQSLQLEFKTPLRLIRNKKIIKPGEFKADFMLKSLIRRISSLEYFHQNIEQKQDFKALYSQLENLAFTQNLRSQITQRYSNRQAKNIPLNGLIGTLNLTPETLPPQVWSKLWIGQYTHIGKACVMGMGQYQIKSQ